MKRIWNKLLVFFGFRVWVKQVYHRPRYQTCAYHNRRMKRGRVTPKGALYFCSLCKANYHLEGGAIKLVPV